ncbi:MAG: STAS domain-containing protein [Acidimicrobiia bacterium]
MAKVPILSLEGFLVVSIQEDLSDIEAEDVQRRLLERVTGSRARGVLIDVSGMDVVDSYFCRILRDTSAMASLMGASTAVVGIAPPVAVTLTELGLELDTVHTDLSLERGLEWLRKVETHA